MGVFETVVVWIEDGYESYTESYAFETQDEAYHKLHELEAYLEGEDDVIIYITKKGMWYEV